MKAEPAADEEKRLRTGRRKCDSLPNCCSTAVTCRAYGWVMSIVDGPQKQSLKFWLRQLTGLAGCLRLQDRLQLSDESTTFVPYLSHISSTRDHMASTKLDGLPKELIAHIACFSDVRSVLQLSLTCKTVRAACYDSLVFRYILLDRQRNFWTKRSLDVEAVADRSRSDAAVWAKYALADEVACELSKSGGQSEIPRQYVSFLPELAVVKHPVMYDECWKRVMQQPLYQKSNQMFCLAIAVFASEHDMPEVSRSLDMQNNEPYYSRDDSMKGFLWAICTIALTLRSTLRTRLAAWPYNNAAVVPHISFPRAGQIPLRPFNDSYSLPAPFSRRAVELLGRSTSSFSGWDSWYDQHNAAFARNLSNITNGTWCGYYVHFGAQAASVDPPMMEIHFRTPHLSAAQLDPMERMRVDLEALDCVDGIAKFNINGTLVVNNREVLFIGSKEYKNSQTRWDWDCRLTPFGLVGYWGDMQSEDGRLSRHGIVWLWKKEWTEV